MSTVVESLLIILCLYCIYKCIRRPHNSISLVRGTICNIHFAIGGNIIPKVWEQPVKSPGRLYAFPLTDKHRGVEVQRTALEGLHAIEKSELPGKLKAWCFQHGLLTRLLWPLQIYEISLSRVESIQQHINQYLHKCLGVLPPPPPPPAAS